VDKVPKEGFKTAHDVGHISLYDEFSKYGSLLVSPRLHLSNRRRTKKPIQNGRYRSCRYNYYDNEWS